MWGTALERTGLESLERTAWGLGEGAWLPQSEGAWLAHSDLKPLRQAGEMMAYHLTDVKWKDGSLHADIPITRISELFNVNHFIVSQTNPHAIPFMSKPQRTRKKQENDEEQSPSMMRRGWWVMRYLVTSELAHRFRQAVTMGLVPKILEATLFQVHPSPCNGAFAWQACAAARPRVALVLHSHLLSER